MIDITRFILSKDVQDNPLIWIHLRGMQLFGYIIFDHQKNPKLHCARGVFFTFCFFLFNLTQYIDLFTKLGNVEEMATNAATTFLFTTTVSRMFNFYANRSQYIQLIKEVHDNIGSIIERNIRAEVKILYKNIRYTKYLTIVFWVLALLTGNLMCVNSLIQALSYQPHIIFDSVTCENKTSFPPVILRSWFPFDDLWSNFPAVYLIQFYIMWLGMIIVPCWNAFFIALEIYAILSLQILNYKLEHMHDYGMMVLRNDPNQLQRKMVANHSVPDESHQTVLIQCVQKYHEIAKFVRILSGLGSNYLLLDFIIFSVLLCTLLFQLSRALFLVQFTIFVCYIITMTGILWMYYWHANEINFYSDLLTLSAYKSKWYDNSRVLNKSLLLFITATKPLNMRTGFFVMTLPVFINILRASYSYFTLLTQLAK